MVKLYLKTIALILSMIVCLGIFIITALDEPRDQCWDYIYFSALLVSIGFFIWISTLFKMKLILYASIFIGIWFINSLISFRYFGFVVGTELILFGIYILFSTRQKILKFIFGTLMISIGIMIFVFTPTTDQKEQEISQKLWAALPSGTSLTKLISYLDTDKIDHGGYDNRNHGLQATFWNVGGSLLITYEYDINFKFDERDKLITFTCDEHPQGP